MGRATEIAAQVLRSSRIGTAAANQWLAEVELHAKSPADLIGALRAHVISLSADLAIARMDGLSQHQKAVSLVADAQHIVEGWLDHAVAGDAANDVGIALDDAKLLLGDVFFEQPADEDMPDPEGQGEARAQAFERSAA